MTSNKIWDKVPVCKDEKCRNGSIFAAGYVQDRIDAAPDETDRKRRLLDVMDNCLYNGILIGAIIAKGFAEHMDDIMHGLNKSSPGLDLFDRYDISSEEFSPTKRASDQNSFMFCMDYLERWEMYYKLFNEIE